MIGVQSFKIPILFIVGPTASGKSDLALKMAQEFNGAIINCDSIQMYKELNIGSAKPTEKDFAVVPHFLFNIAQFPNQITAGEYVRAFENLLNEIEQNQKNKFKVLIVVGGTGFYFQALEKGMLDAGVIAPDILLEIKQKAQTHEGRNKLYQELLEVDPDCAQWIHANDQYRIERALGIWLTEGKKISDLKKQETQSGLTAKGYKILKWGVKVEKAVLENRIRDRIEKMFATGFEKEVRDLLADGVDPLWLPLQSVGYKEMLEFILTPGAFQSVSDLKEKILISTRQLAKKQRTWFQRDSEITWWTNEETEFARIALKTFLG